MNRLTEKDGQGNWQLKGLPWKCLRIGEVITTTMHDRLYGALCKLKDYEDTGLSPDEVERLNDFERSQVGKMLKKLAEERNRHRWIPVEEKLPQDDRFVLMSFDNFSQPLIGRYETDKGGGGAFYAGDDEESCSSQGLFVNAWMPLPEPYRQQSANTAPKPPVQAERELEGDEH